MDFTSPAGEQDRLAALRSYGILDTPPEEDFDHITATASRLFGAPIALITLIDDKRQWFKSACGLTVRETPRELSFCAHTMEGEGVVVIPDATLDPRFAGNLLVTGKPFIRFYAGAPLRSPEGHALGALCVISPEPRRFNWTERRMLAELAGLVEDELLLRRVASELAGTKPQPPAAGPPSSVFPKAGLTTGCRKASNIRRLGTRAIGSNPDGYPALPAAEQGNDAIIVYDLRGRFEEVNAAACRLFGYERDELLGMELADLEIGFDPIRNPKRWKEMEGGRSITMEGINRRKDGSTFWAEVRVSALDDGEDRRLLALVRDITARKHAEASLQMRVRQQKAAANLGLSALRGGALEPLLDEAVAVVVDTLEIEICRVLEHLPARGEFITRAGLHLPEKERGTVAATDSISHAAGHVLRTGVPVIIKDVLDDERYEPTPWLRASGAVSGMHVPIGGDGSHSPVYGVLAAYTREERVFTEDDLSFVQTVANVLAAAVSRRRGEEQLRAVEARYGRIAAYTPSVVYQYLLRPDGGLEIPFISESCFRLYGLTSRQLQARPERMMEAVHAEDRPGFQKEIRRAERTLTPLHWECRLVLPDGEIRSARFDSRPERLPDGGIICDGIIVDVTEEEKREEALRQSEKRFRLANFHAPFPIMLHAGDGEILQVNDAWVHLTGHTAEELETMDDWLLLAYSTKEARDAMRAFIAQSRECVGTVESLGQRIRCRDDEERVWDFRSANLDRLPDGRSLHILTATDVTEQRRYEETLRQAKEEAERANAAKSQFLSRMSHEMRTPLNAILGFGQLLEIATLETADHQSVEQILLGGRHLLSLVDEVLDLARVESGELDLQLTSVSFLDVARECAQLVERTAQARGVVCQVEARRGEQPAVLADEQRLRQVLLNLLSNAIKYNRPGGRVRVSCSWAASGRLRLNVMDDGPGISAVGVARLFVPFERLGQEFGEVEGTGLGLVVSKRLVEAMGGSLGVVSEPERGSTFWVDLPEAPTSEPKEEVAAPSPAPVPAAALPVAAPVAAALLYIEDNHSNVQVVKMMVARLRPHWQFRFATDGQSGLDQAREHHPDVILLDLQLPVLKGDAVLAALQADEDTRGIPVILLSADAMAHSRERLLALGAHDYLAKPFDVAGLLTRIDALLGRCRQAEPGRCCIGSAADPC